MDIRTLLKGEPIAEREGVLFFSDPPADIVPSRDALPGDPRTWSHWRRENYRFLERELAGCIPGATLVDVGAGQSDFRELTKKFSVCAFDFYPYPGVDVVCDFASSLPLKDHSADIVLLTNVLEHVREPNVLLTECHRILKPGGVLLGTVPFLIKIHQRPYDFYRYTEGNLSYLFRKHGFQNVQVIPVSNLSVFLFNTATSFFIQAIKEARFKLPWRIIWRIVRIAFSLFRGVSEKRFFDPENPLGYLFQVYRGKHVV